MAHPRRWLALALGVAALALAGCGPATGPAGTAASTPADPLAAVTVTGGAFAAPQVAFTPPLAIGAPQRRVEIPGTGAEVAPGGPLLLRYQVFDAQTGRSLADTYSGRPVVLHLTEGELDAATYQALQGARYGERVTAAAPSADGTANPAIFVIDVLPLRAQGQAVKAKAGMPPVAAADDGTPQIRPAAIAPPAGPRAAVLIEGEGPEVRPGDDLVVQSLAQKLDDGTVTQSTWADGQPLAVRLQDTVEAWRDTLPGVRVGSRVEVLSPPEFAAGDGAMVYVIDVLAAAAPAKGAAT